MGGKFFPPASQPLFASTPASAPAQTSETAPATDAGRTVQSARKGLGAEHLRFV